MTRNRALALFLTLGFCAASVAGAQTLESSVLRLEVASQPYGFRVIEKSTGDLLLIHTRTTLASANTVQNAVTVQTEDNSLKAQLRGYAGATSQATFTFITPE